MNEYRRRTLRKLLDSGELVNCILRTEDGGNFRVHLELMAGKSPYLKRIIINTSKDPGSEMLGPITIPGASREVVGNVITFMYTYQLEVSYDTVEEMISLGELLKMPDVVCLCKKFLATNNTDDRCIAIYNIANRYRYADLKETAKAYILKRFQHVFPVSSDYLELVERDLMELLSSDHLNVTGEEQVFHAILRWVEGSKEDRAASMANLLRCVRFGLCSRQFFNRHVIPNTHVSNNEECQFVLLQASQLFEDMPNSEDDPRSRLRTTMLDIRHPFLRPRIPSEMIFVMGGWSAGSATNIIETFDFNSGRWFLSLHSDTIPRAYHGMLWHQGYVYVIGGFDGHQCFSTVRRFDAISHTWTEVSCMHEQRCYVSVASVGEYIYAMGGFDGQRRNRTCERFDPSANQWDKVSSMNHVRSDASADALHGKVYIVGGFNGQEVLNSAEFYDPVTDEWTQITEMIGPRSGVKLVAYCEHLYVIGGFNGSSRLSTVDRYDPQTRRWSSVPGMHSPRSNFATAILHGCLYVIGGFNGLSTISAVEYYDKQKNAWQMATELNLNRSALAACTIKDIPNFHEYTFLGNAPQL